MKSRQAGASMRMLFLTNLYPPHDLGGLEQQCQEVAERLKLHGHDVTVLTSRHGLAARAKPYAEARVGILRSLYLENGLDYYRPLHFFTKYRAEQRGNLRELRRVIDICQPDVIVIWGMWQLSVNLPFFAEQWLPGRVVHYIASYWPTDADPHTAYWQLPARHRLAEFAKRPLRGLALARLRRDTVSRSALKFEHVVCCSEYVRNMLSRNGLRCDEEVIYAGIDQTPFRSRSLSAPRPEGAPLQLLCFGRLIHDKGMHVAIEAMALLKQRGMIERFRLTIMGSGHPDYVAGLRHSIEDAGLQGHVSLIGKVPRPQIPEVLTKYDVLLFTSIWPEPFGRTIVEGMLAGLVVIGSDVGGSREIFRHYDDTLLFPAGDAETLVERLVRLWSDPNLHNRLVARGREVALERFTLETTVDAIEARLRKVVDETPIAYRPEACAPRAATPTVKEFEDRWAPPAARR